MMSRKENVRRLIETAIAEVRKAIMAGGDEQHPLEDLKTMDRELNEMLVALDADKLPPRGQRSAGMGRHIVDSWPLVDPLGDCIVAAEREYDRL